MKMKWVPEYNTGIDVIDDQHKRILDYINEIDSIDANTDRDRVKQILENIIDYTQSHFTFEESLQEEAGYKYRVPHKRVHDLFIKKIESYRDRFEMGRLKVNCMKSCLNGSSTIFSTMMPIMWGR